PAVASEQRIGLSRRVRSDQEIGDEAIARQRRLSALTPEPTCQRGCFGRDGLEADSEYPQSVMELRVRGEVGANLRPDDLARDEGSSVICGTHRLARRLPEAGICCEHVQEDGRVDRCLHRFRGERRTVRRAAGRGPRISSMRASTGLGSLSRPKTWSTGWVPPLPFRMSTPPSVSSNSTAVPGASPSFSLTAAGTVIFPW